MARSKKGMARSKKAKGKTAGEPANSAETAGEPANSEDDHDHDHRLAILHSRLRQTLLYFQNMRKKLRDRGLRTFSGVFESCWKEPVGATLELIISCLRREGKEILLVPKEEMTAEFFEKLAGEPGDHPGVYILVAITKDFILIYCGSSISIRRRFNGHIQKTLGDDNPSSLLHFLRLCKEYGVVPLYITLSDTSGQKTAVRELAESCVIWMMGLFETHNEAPSFVDQHRVRNLNLPSEMGRPPNVKGANQALPLYFGVGSEDEGNTGPLQYTCQVIGCNVTRDQRGVSNENRQTGALELPIAK